MESLPIFDKECRSTSAPPEISSSAPPPSKSLIYNDFAFRPYLYLIGGVLIPVVHMSAPPLRAGTKGAGRGGEASDCGPTGVMRPPRRQGRQKQFIAACGDPLERPQGADVVSLCSTLARAPLPLALRVPSRCARRGSEERSGRAGDGRWRCVAATSARMPTERLATTAAPALARSMPGQPGIRSHSTACALQCSKLTARPKRARVVVGAAVQPP